MMLPPPVHWLPVSMLPLMLKLLTILGFARYVLATRHCFLTQCLAWIALSTTRTPMGDGNTAHILAPIPAVQLATTWYTHLQRCWHGCGQAVRSPLSDAHSSRARSAAGSASFTCTTSLSHTHAHLTSCLLLLHPAAPSQPLHSMSMMGELPAEIGYFVNVTMLSLWANQIYTACCLHRWLIWTSSLRSMLL